MTVQNLQSRSLDYNFPRIITLQSQVKGRLGNQMLAYSLLLGARKILGFRVFLQEEVLQNLKYYFPLANAVSMHGIYVNAEIKQPFGINNTLKLRFRGWRACAHTRLRFRGQYGRLLSTSSGRESRAMRFKFTPE